MNTLQNLEGSGWGWSTGLQNLDHADFHEINTDGALHYKGHKANLDVGRFNGGVTSDITVGL